MSNRLDLSLSETERTLVRLAIDEYMRDRIQIRAIGIQAKSVVHSEPDLSELEGRALTVAQNAVREHGDESGLDANADRVLEKLEVAE